MTDYLKTLLRGQYEAALCMAHQCVRACPEAHWEDKIGQGPFRCVVYHMLFFTELYLWPNEEAFVLRDVHREGGDERGPDMSPGLSKAATLEYVEFCRHKVVDTLGAETQASLEGPSGFSYRRFSRGELHVYNIRHIQHHTGQLSAFLRRLGGEFEDHRALPWIGTGWR